MDSILAISIFERNVQKTMGESILLLLLLCNTILIVFYPSLRHLSKLIERNYCSYSNYCKSIFHPRCYLTRPPLVFYCFHYSSKSLSSYMLPIMSIISPILSRSSIILSSTILSKLTHCLYYLPIPTEKPTNQYNLYTDKDSCICFSILIYHITVPHRYTEYSAAYP